MQTSINSILRIVQFILVLIATGLIGNVRANSQHAAGTATAAINYAIFVLVLAWIAIIYSLIIHFVSSIAMPIVSLALDAAVTLFSIISAIVLSAKLTAVNCGSYGQRPSDWIAFGSNDTEKRCREIQAGVVFMWLLFATFVATLFFAFKEFRRNGGSVRGPSMSQIGV